MKIKDSFGNIGEQHIKKLPALRAELLEKLRISYLDYIMSSIGVDSYTIDRTDKYTTCYVIKTENDKLDIRSEIRLSLNSVYDLRFDSIVINSLSADKLYRENFITDEEYLKYRRSLKAVKSITSADVAIKYISSRINTPLVPDYVIHITDYRYIIGSSRTPFKMYVLKRMKDGKILGKYFSNSAARYVHYLSTCKDKVEDKDLLNDYLELFKSFEYVSSYYSIFKLMKNINATNTLIRRVNLTNTITFNLKCK